MGRNLAAGSMVLALSLWAGCERNEETAVLKAEEPAPKVMEQPPPVVARTFVLVADDTPLFYAPDEKSSSTPAKTLGADVVVILEEDRTEPPPEPFMRVRSTEQRSGCGYPAMALTEPMYVLRGDLLRTLRAAKTIEGAGKTTSFELRPGVALRRTTDGAYLVLTNSVRAKLELDPSELTAELGVATLADTAREIGETVEPDGPRTPLRVGRLEVHLSKKMPPPLGAVAGHPELARVEAPCVSVVGALPPPPSNPLTAMSDARSRELAKALADLDLSMLDAIANVPADPLGGLDRRGLDAPMGAGVSAGATSPGGGGIASLRRSGGASESATTVVRLGTVAATGALSSAQARHVATAAVSRFRRCYDRALREAPDLSGRILLSLHVDALGTVSSARSLPKSASEPGGTDLESDTVVACVVAVARLLRFPAPSGEEGAADVLVTVTFAPR